MLVIAQAQDGTANLVVGALLARDADVARIDTAELPGSLFLAATPERADSPGWLHSPMVSNRSGVGGQCLPTPSSPIHVSCRDVGAIGLCCHLFQEGVPKAFDVRLTVVGDRCFAVAVHASSPEAEVNWHCRYDELRHEVCETPDDVCRGVIAYLRTFNLVFGAFDFSVTPDGRWWFLECNPPVSGGGSLKRPAPIAEAIADELVRAA